MNERIPTADELTRLVARLAPHRADATRDDWVKIGMAIHDADPSDLGYGLWEDFSRQSPKFNLKDCQRAWKSFKPGAVTFATLIKFANDDDPGGRQRPQETPMITTKRDYSGLDDYADAHGVPGAILRAAGWSETRHDSRPALKFTTTTGTRWRFLDGEKPAYDSPFGFKRCWYGLEKAVALAKRTNSPLVLVNGEASAVAAQHHGIPAVAIAGGTEKTTIPEDLRDELLNAYDGPILIALDCDDAGRKAARGILAQLRELGIDARAVDLQGSHGFDVADYCMLNNGTSATAIHALPDLPPERTVTPLSPPRDSAEPRTPRFRVATEDDLMALPPLEYLDRDLCVVARAYHLIYGPSGSGKTFFAIERAMRLAATGYRVLYVPTEDVSGLRYRVAAWRRANPEASGRLTWLHMPEGLDLQDHAQVADLLEAIDPYQYDLVTIDTLREAHSGDENSSQDTRRINRAMQAIIASGAAVDVVHHTGVAGERPRGSTALYGNNDVVIEVENDDGNVQVAFKKLRAPQREPLSFAIVPQDTGLFDTDGEGVMSAILRPSNIVPRTVTKMTPTGRKILEALALSIFSDSGARTKQLVDAAKLTENKTFYRALSFLKDNSYIEQSAKGDPYTITRAGRAQLGPELSLGNTASVSPTVTTVTPLSPTVTDSATVLSVTVTTHRGDSDDSGMTVDTTDDLFSGAPTCGVVVEDLPDIARLNRPKLNVNTRLRMEAEAAAMVRDEDNL